MKCKIYEYMDNGRKYFKEQKILLETAQDLDSF